MQRRPSFQILFMAIAIAVLFCTPQTNALAASGPKEFSSDTAAKTFYDLALQIANSEDVNQAKAERAIIFLQAASRLDKKATYIIPDLIKLIRKYSPDNKTQLVKQLLQEYTNKRSIDFEVIKNAVSYLLDKAGSRENREQLVQELFANLRNRDSHLDSEMLATYAFLRQEVADPNTTNLLLLAYSTNRYNRVLFSKLRELVPDKLTAFAQLEHFRLILGENPLDLDVALSYADLVRRLELYQTASDAYRYCADLYNYLYPKSAGLPAEIYLPWALSDYNNPGNQFNCLRLSKQIQQEGRFDLVLQAIAARAALSATGRADSGEAEQIFEQAEKKAKEIYNSDKSNVELAKKLAWYYCFARPDSNQALEWTATTYSLDPNSPMAAALHAYSLLSKKQTESAPKTAENQAKQLAEKYQDNQIAQIVLAKIALAESNPDKAAENLKNAIAKDPSSLEAKMAKKLLAELGQSFIALPNANIGLAMFKNAMQRPLVPTFVTPDRILSFEFNIRGTRLRYASDFGATLTIKNISAEPIVISDNALFTGRIRVDAEISGGIKKTIPNLVNLKIEPTNPIEPGKSTSVDLNLLTGQLQQILLSHPQGVFQIDFTVYIDPVIANGKTINKLADIKPLKCKVERTGEQITGQSLQHLYDSINKNYSTPKINAARLFAGLLAEHYEPSRSKISYKTFYADNLPQFLKSGLLKCLDDKDWEVKTQALGAMKLNSLPLDTAFTKKLSESFNPPQADWPVRLLAAYMLAERIPDFHKTIKYDSDELVRQMAVSFGAKLPAELQKNTAAAPKEPNKPDANAIPKQSAYITK